MKILYGTTNHGKLLIMEKAMAKVGLEMIGPTDLGLPLPAITEAGKTPLENSEIKAKAYYAAFHMPVFHQLLISIERKMQCKVVLMA